MGGWLGSARLLCGAAALPPIAGAGAAGWLCSTGLSSSLDQWAGRACSSRHLPGIGLELAYCPCQSKSCAGQLPAHGEAATGAWMQRGVKSWGQQCRLPQLLLTMVISLHCLNWRVIEVLPATCTLGIHRRRLLPGEGQEICTQRQSSLRDVALSDCQCGLRSVASFYRLLGQGDV